MLMLFSAMNAETCDWKFQNSGGLTVMIAKPLELKWFDIV